MLLTIGLPGIATAQGEVGDDPIVAVPFESVPEGTLLGGGQDILLDSSTSVSGSVRVQGVHKVGLAAPTTYEVTTDRYVVESPPATVGVVVPLDQAIFESLCKDIDGCQVLLQMVNWDNNQNVASAIFHLFSSLQNGNWRTATPSDVTGVDGAGGVQEFNAFDCYFGDSETYNGAPNTRADNGPGWGLLNCAGCNYSDAITTCRVALID